MNDYYRPGGFSMMPPAVKNLLIINVLFFAATWILQGRGIDLNQMAAKLVADEAQAGILVSALDDKKKSKLASLMVKDMELAKKAAAAYVQQELKKQGECQS